MKANEHAGGAYCCLCPSSEVCSTTATCGLVTACSLKIAGAALQNHSWQAGLLAAPGVKGEEATLVGTGLLLFVEQKEHCSKTLNLMLFSVLEDKLGSHFCGREAVSRESQSPTQLQCAERMPTAER